MEFLIKVKLIFQLKIYASVRKRKAREMINRVRPWQREQIRLHSHIRMKRMILNVAR